MSARIEQLHTQLANVKKTIAERVALGQPIDDLVSIEESISKQLSKARELLTEGSTKVILRG
jgi:hypothetical protein